jgi:pimeloyl-ACP methyl ester carboxylesterase
MKEMYEIAMGPTGQRLHCVRGGMGPSVVLIHGIPTHGFLWRKVAEHLVVAGREVIIPDLLGYGKSDKPNDVDLGIAAQADRLLSLLPSIGWKEGTVIGHDIGGGVAQLMALRDSIRLRRLVLVDAIAYDSFPEPGIARLKDPVWDDILGAPDFDLAKGLTKGFIRGMVRSELVTPDFIRAYETPFAGIEGRKAYLRAARALKTEQLSTRMGQIERLKIPAQMIWGACDEFQPLSNGSRLASAMPNAELQVIDHAGHFLPEDAPEALAASIIEFTTRQEKMR